jgi:hypothetical protein
MTADSCGLHHANKDIVPGFARVQIESGFVAGGAVISDAETNCPKILQVQTQDKRPVAICVVTSDVDADADGGVAVRLTSVTRAPAMG